MNTHGRVSGCYYFVRDSKNPDTKVQKYLSPVDLVVHTTVLGCASSTVLTQVFKNPSTNQHIEELKYGFPLFDGVSVVKFECAIGDRTIKGVVQEKQKAKRTFDAALADGKTAVLLEQLPNTAEIFVTTLGLVPPGSTITVNITYVGELMHDAENDGIKVTIPTHIAPRYGSYPSELIGALDLRSKGMFTVDAMMPQGSWIQKIISPSHPIAVSIGSLSMGNSGPPNLALGSATLSLDETQLDEDFVLYIVLEKGAGDPKAFLEEHSAFPGQRVVMATVVPRFQLKQIRPEIVFMVDRSGSMHFNIPTVITALKTFLKSLPIGVMFNVCSFGSNFEFLWEESQSYTEENVELAVRYVEVMSANMMGTVIHKAMEAVLRRRLGKVPLEVLLLTDGSTWELQKLLQCVTQHIAAGPGPLRVFCLGIGSGTSYALVNAVAKAGGGFSQTVTNKERFEGKVVRMLKGALSPHVDNYSVEVQYEENPESEGDDEFEMVDDSDTLSSTSHTYGIPEKPRKTSEVPISLFDPKVDMDTASENQWPTIEMPNFLHVPHKLTPLYAFNRTTFYVLLAPELSHLKPKALLLKASSPDGPLELKIEIQCLDKPGEMLHQLAARKAIQELEEGKGWVLDAKDSKGMLIEENHPGYLQPLQSREAVVLGVRYQVCGKWTSFVAVDGGGTSELQVGQNNDEINLNNTPRFLQSPNHRRPMRACHTVPTGDRIGTSRTVAAVAMTNQPGKLFPSDEAGQAVPQAQQGHATDQSQQDQVVEHRQQLQANHQAHQVQAAAQQAHQAQASQQFRQIQAYQQVQECQALQQVQQPQTAERIQDSTGIAQRPYRTSTVYSYVPPQGSESLRTNKLKIKRSTTSMPSVSYRSFVPHDSNDTAPSGVRQRARQLEPPQAPLLQELINSQSFEGSWRHVDIIHHQMKLGEDVHKVVEDMVTSLPIQRQLAEAAIATSIVLEYLAQKLANEKDVWELVAEKAKAWLVGTLDAETLERVRMAAKDLVEKEGMEPLRGVLG